MRIAARVASLHDDLPDALVLATTGIPQQIAMVPAREVPDGMEFAETPAGIKIPLPVRTIRSELDWGEAYAPSAFEADPDMEPSIWDEVYGVSSKKNPVQRMTAGYVSTTA